MELGRLTPHVTFGVFTAIGLLMMCAIGGVFEGASVAVGGTSGSVKVDAPFTLGMLTTGISLFGIIAHAGIAGGAASRDFSVGMHPLVFTTPISKWSLFGARLFTTVGVNLYVMSGTSAGLLIGLLAVDSSHSVASALFGFDFRGVELDQNLLPTILILDRDGALHEYRFRTVKKSRHVFHWWMQSVWR